MSQDAAGQRLHDRATRGETLSAEEQARLKEWYARLDNEEAAALVGAATPAAVAALRSQIEAAVAQLGTLAERVKSLTAENAAVRQEIASLQRLLAAKSAPQPA